MDQIDEVNWMAEGEEWLGANLGGATTAFADRAIQKWIIKDKDGVSSKNRAALRGLVQSLIGGAVSVGGKMSPTGSKFISAAGCGMTGAAGRQITDSLLSERLDEAFSGNFSLRNLFGISTSTETANNLANQDIQSRSTSSGKFY